MEEKAYWNDPSMPFSYKGKDVFAGGLIPEGYAEEQPEKFKSFQESGKISFNPDKTLKSATQEIDLVKKKHETLKGKVAELAKQEKELQEKIDSMQASIVDAEKYEAVVQELEALKSEKEALPDQKKSSKKGK